LSKIFDYQCLYKTLDTDFGTYDVKIYAYDGEGDPDWLEDESGYLLPNFRHVCTIMADLSGLRSSLKVQKGREGQDFWRVSFNINVRFGGTAIKAKMTWNEGVSISHSIHGSADICFCLSGSPARRPCECHTKLSLLNHVWLPSKGDEKLDPNERLPFCIILFDTIDVVK